MLKIQDSYATGTLSGYAVQINYIAGLASGYDREEFPEVINCYAATKDAIEGLVNIETVYANRYYDSNLVYNDYYINSNARTTEQMYQKTNCEGWVFETVWGINEGKDYPKLKFEETIRGRNKL